VQELRLESHQVEESGSVEALANVMLPTMPRPSFSSPPRSHPKSILEIAIDNGDFLASGTESAREASSLSKLLRRERVTVDVMDAMEKALQGATLPRSADLSYDASTLPQQFNPALTEQIRTAEMHLCAKHEEVMQELVARREEQKRELTAEVNEHRTRASDVKARLDRLRSTWVDERGRLERRASNSEVEHRALENNLLREISRLEGSTAAATDALGGATLGAPGSTIAQDIKEMGDALRQTYSFMCEQQQQLHEATQERDLLQSHLVTAIERISRRQHAGLIPEPPPSALAAPLLSHGL